MLLGAEAVDAVESVGRYGGAADTGERIRGWCGAPMDRAKFCIGDRGGEVEAVTAPVSLDPRGGGQIVCDGYKESE